MATAYKTFIICVGYVFFFYFFSKTLFEDPRTDILTTFPHGVALANIEMLLCRLYKISPKINEGRLTPISARPL